MSQTLGSLNIGDIVYNPYTYTSGQGGTQGLKRAGSCHRFRIIDKNHDGSNTVTLRAINSSDSRYFDYAESTNPDSDRQTKGNSRYKVSNILQWLNSDAASNWYVAQHTYDAVYQSSNNNPGYLYNFGTNFKSALQSVTRTTAVPTIDGGGTETVSKKVHLASITELTGETVNGYSEGSHFSYYANSYDGYVSESRSAWYDSTNNVVDGSHFEYDRRINKDAGTITGKEHREAQFWVSSHPIIVLPSSTLVSSTKYKNTATTTSTGDAYESYALIDMPLIIQINGSNISKISPTITLKYTVYDETSASISTFKIAKDTQSNVIYSTVNLTKGNEYTYTENGSSWAIDEQHTYYFIATNSNGTEVVENKIIKRENIRPTIKLYDGSEWTNFNNLGDQTKPPTIRLRIADADNEGQDINVYLNNNSWLYSSYPPLATIGQYTTDTEIEYTIPTSVWENLSNNSHYNLYCHATNGVYTGSSTLETSYCYIQFTKKTPAPTVDVDDVTIGDTNVGFSVDYTPNILTLQTIENVSIYLDSTSTLISSDDNPVAGQEYTYTMTKSALYELPLGNHKLIFTATDDLNQTGTTEVTFTRVNNAPAFVVESALGNKHLGFDFDFTVSDVESDTITVVARMDSAIATPFATFSNLASGDTETVDVTKSALYDLSLGAHTIYLTATDSESQSTSAQVTFTRVNDAPVITAETNLGDKNGAFSFTYSATDTESDALSAVTYIDSHVATIATHSSLVDGQTYTDTVTKSTLYDLALGAHTITIEVTDSVGQTSSKTLNFSRVNNSPNIQCSFDGGDIYDDFDLIFTVTDMESDPVNVEIKVDNQRVKLLSNVTLNTQITENIDVSFLATGNHSVQIIATDSESQTSSFTESFYKDERPTITATDYGVTIDDFVTTYQVYDDGASVTVGIKLDGTLMDTRTVTSSDYNKDIILTISGVSSLTYTTHTITIRATDLNGEYSEKNITFTRKSVPTVSITIPPLPEVTVPFNIAVTYDNADGDEVTVSATLDGEEIEVS